MQVHGKLHLLDLEGSERQNKMFLLATQMQVHGKLHLVDLAGSERQNKALTVGSGAVEAKHINRSANSQTSVRTSTGILEQTYLDTEIGFFFFWFAALSQRCMT